MAEKREKKEGLLRTLLDCFTKLGITYVEITQDEKYYLTTQTTPIDKLWDVCFCEEFRKLSIAPSKENKDYYNLDVLRKLRQGKVCSQTRTIITENIIPNFSSSIGLTYIDKQKEHIIVTLENAIRAKNTRAWLDDNIDKRYRDKYLPAEKLIKREEVRAHIYSIFTLLKELFEGESSEIIASDSGWFSKIVSGKLPEIDSDEAENLFASVFAAAMVLGLNQRDSELIPASGNNKVDKKIEEYLLALFDEWSKRKAGQEQEKEKAPENSSAVAYNQPYRVRTTAASQELGAYAEAKMEEFKLADEDDATESVRAIMRYISHMDKVGLSKVHNFFEDYIAALQKVHREDSFKYLLCLIVRARSQIEYFDKRICELQESLNDNRYSDLKEKTLQDISDLKRSRFMAGLEYDDLNQQLHERSSVILF